MLAKLFETNKDGNKSTLFGLFVFHSLTRVILCIFFVGFFFKNGVEALDSGAKKGVFKSILGTIFSLLVGFLRFVFDLSVYKIFSYFFNCN